jgi:hypothetical protein
VRDHRCVDGYHALVAEVLMEPSNKSEAMESFLDQQARDMFGRSRIESFKYGICVCCGKPADQFKDNLSVKEYSISGLCQKCQDETFG